MDETGSALTREQRATAPDAQPGLVTVRATAVRADPTGAAARVSEAVLARSAVRRGAARGCAGAELVLHAQAVPFHVLEGKAAQAPVAAAALAAPAVARQEVCAGAAGTRAARAARSAKRRRANARDDGRAPSDCGSNPDP